MVNKRKYTTIKMLNKELQIDDFQCFNKGLVFVLKDDILIAYDEDGEETSRTERIRDIVISNQSTNINLSSSEEFVQIERVGWDYAKEAEAIRNDNTGASWIQSDYLVFHLKSNYGTTALFQVELRNNAIFKIDFVQIEAFHKFDLETREVDGKIKELMVREKRPSGEYFSEFDPVEGVVEHLIGISVKQLSNGSIKHTKLIMPENMNAELPIVKNYLGNINNYKVLSWGGLGGIKDTNGVLDAIRDSTNKTARQQLIISYYGIGAFLDNYFEARATLERKKVMHGKDKVSGGFSVLNIGEVSEADFFKAVYLGEGIGANVVFAPAGFRAQTGSNGARFFPEIQGVTPCLKTNVFEEKEIKKTEGR